MPGLTVTHIDHVSVIVTDLTRARRFYRDVLGLTEIPKPRTFNFVALWFDLGGGQVTNCVPQPGTDRRLDVQGDKIMARLVYRRIGDRESIVAVHSVATAAGGGILRYGTAHSAVALQLGIVPFDQLADVAGAVEAEPLCDGQVMDAGLASGAGD